MTLSVLKKTILITLAGFSLMACGRGNNNGMTVRNANGAGLTSPNGSLVSGGSCYGSKGRIFDAASSAHFEQRVKGLVSATVNPAEFGIIESSATATKTCVALEGRLSFDSTGTVDLNQSTLKIIIYDSYVGQKNINGESIEAYVIQFSAASAGQINLSNKNFSLQFKDEYGEIQLTGVVTSTTTTGSLSYQNYKSFDNGAAAASVLGDFSIATSSFVY